MTKPIIGALVGGFILFMWQFASWAPLQLHQSQNQYTDNQAEILQFMDGKLKEGAYFMPTMPPGASSEDQQELMDSALGKPWMRVEYHNEFKMNMGMNMFRGFVVNVVSVFLLCWILLKIPQRDFMTCFLASLFVGLISYMNIPYIESIWFENNSIPDLIDAIVQWGLCGAWLGFWLNR